MLIRAPEAIASSPRPTEPGNGADPISQTRTLVKS
jgi:hypothetical protein